MNKFEIALQSCENISESSLTEIKNLLREEEFQNGNWENFGEVNGVRMWNRGYRNSSVKCFVGKKKIAGNPVSVSKVMWGLTLEQMKRNDKSISTYKTLAKITTTVPQKEMRVDYMNVNLPWPIWNRDLLMLASYKVIEEENTIFVWFTSIKPPNKADNDHEEKIQFQVPQSAKTIRSTVTVSCYKFQALPNSSLSTSSHTTITRIIHVDPEGSIPSVIINSQATSQVAGMVNLLEGLSKIPSKL